MYFVIAFHSYMNTIIKVWVRTDEQVIGLLKEGLVVYRCSTDQRASLVENGGIVWTDMKEVKE